MLWKYKYSKKLEIVNLYFKSPMVCIYSPWILFFCEKKGLQCNYSNNI